MANRAVDIVTRFTLAGLAQTRSAIRSIETSMRDMASRASAATTDLARRAGAAVKRQFANVVEASVTQATKRIEQATKGIVALGKATKNVGFSAMEKSAKSAFVGIGVAAAAAAAKVALAMKVTQTSADDLSAKDLRRQQTGVSVGDQDRLQYLSEKQGTGKDDLINALQGVASTIRELERGRDLNKDTTVRGNSFLRLGLRYARQSGDAESLQALIAQSQSAGMANLDSVEHRMRRMEALIKSIRGGRIASLLDRQYVKNGADDVGIAEMRRQQAALLTPLIVQYQQLTEASKALREAMGPQGRALEDLKEVGLNADVAMSGGIEGLSEIAEALQKFDPERQKELVRGLFGDTTHLPVLRGGRAGVMRDQIENERYSGKVTDEDGERSSRLKSAELARNRSIDGFKLTTARLLSPLLEESNRQFADWLAENRARIAVWVKETFVAVRKVVYDIGRLFDGRTDFESALFKFGATVIDWSKKTYASVYQTATEAYQYAVAKIAEIRDEFAKVMDGKESKWAWLNVAVAGFETLKALAVDIFAVFTGGEAVRFDWLNDARDTVQNFFKRLEEAWAMFKKVLGSIHDAVKPLLKFFNTDILTAALFLGMLRFSGILGGLLGTVRLLVPAFGGLFAGMGVAAAAVAGQVALIGAALYGAWQAGEWLGGKLAQPLVDKYAALDEKTAAFMKNNDTAYMNDKLDRAKGDDKLSLLQGMYGHSYGRATEAQRKAAYAKYVKDKRAAAYAGNGLGPAVLLDLKGNSVKASDQEVYQATERLEGRKAEAKKVELTFLLNGKESTGTFGLTEGDALVQELLRAQRMGQ